MRRDVPLNKLQRTGKFSLRTLWQLRQLIVREQPAVVVSVNLYSAIYLAFVSLLAPRPRPRTVALVNTSSTANKQYARRFYQWVLGRLHHTVHGSQAQRQAWCDPTESGWRKSSVIYNGVDSDFFEPTTAIEDAKRLRAMLGVKPDSLLIGSVSQLRPEKNQEVLLTTLRRLRVAGVDAHLVLAGDGPMRERLARRAAELEVAHRVTFIGELDDVRPVLGAIDIFVLPSVAVESFSNAALEAMSMGKPVILSDIGGAREMIDDGVEGYVVSLNELAARLPAMIAALYADRRKRQQMGIAARRRAVACFSVAAMLAGYRAVLQGGGEE